MKDLLPSAFSFMLPGLGQVYQRRFFAASVIFSAFTVLHLYAPARLLLPLAALAASLEAFLRTPRPFDRKIKVEGTSFEERSPMLEEAPFGAVTSKLGHPPSRFRVYVFSTTAVIGFLGWLSFAATAFLPVGATLETKEAADHLANEVRQCSKLLGHYPSGFFECPFKGFDPQELKDPWGRPYHYETTTPGFEIRSLGPDGIFSTQDDYRFTYR